MYLLESEIKFFQQYLHPMAFSLFLQFRLCFDSQTHVFTAHLAFLFGSLVGIYKNESLNLYSFSDSYFYFISKWYHYLLSCLS